MKITFINGERFPCGCSVHTSDGHGEYSDSITVSLCTKHSPTSDPEKDAVAAGYYNSAAGSWVKEPVPVPREPVVNRLLEAVKELEKTMQCNCDLDNWEPELSTGHSCVCRIHKAAMGAPEDPTPEEIARACGNL